MLIELRKSSDILFDANDIYLHSIAEVASFPNYATPLQWISFRPFGGEYSSISTILTSEKVPIAFYGFASDDSEHEIDDENKESKPFVDFSQEGLPDDPLYKSFLRRKNRGEELSLDDLSDGDLFTLFVIERHLNKEVSELFNAKPSTVASRRRRAGATMKEIAERELLNDLDFMDTAMRLLDN